MILSVPIVLLFCVLLYKCLLDFGLSPKSAKHAVLPEEDFDCRAAYPNEWKTFGFALGVRVLVMVAALFCIMIGANEQVSLWDCLAKLRLWDTNHYINLIDKGYSAYQENGEHLFLVFYPCYVWLVRIVKLIIPNTAQARSFRHCACHGGAAGYTSWRLKAMINRLPMMRCCSCRFSRFRSFSVRS